ncbi:TPA: hypothetical protein QDB45_001654 [Burkholderia vietnamiensis]|nr:hypothetical protein [Burkholderia vietnamiensis]
MITGPFVLRKTKAARSASVQVQPAQPVQPVQVQRERVEGNAGPQGAAFPLNLKPAFRGVAIGFSISGIQGLIMSLALPSYFGPSLGIIMFALLFGCLSMVMG